MSFRQCSFFLGLLFFISVTQADEIFHKARINMLYPYTDGYVYVGIDNEHGSCQHGYDYYRLEVGRVGVTEESIDRIYTAMLAAAAQGNQVEIVFEPSPDGNCYISRIKVFY
ncbi:hypothetical protein BGP77_03905 [Saccharospirillum sp. MSK14-1]|uniref:hypothetical protein n=1 Tax=Saccharospirillum sp. MSK14-1 TaxID=1897632 RepID=UPI000D3A2863|nr:hypothetical protein [Saccharospirillum sp. MSK14-1]PTY36453.1 hypothetical protein BGP77_03905 [Saccharospirillum sp. MSK14-1]